MLDIAQTILIFNAHLLNSKHIVSENANTPPLSIYMKSEFKLILVIFERPANCCENIIPKQKYKFITIPHSSIECAMECFSIFAINSDIFISFFMNVVRDM